MRSISAGPHLSYEERSRRRGPAIRVRGETHPENARSMNATPHADAVRRSPGALPRTRPLLAGEVGRCSSARFSSPPSMRHAQIRFDDTLLALNLVRPSVGDLAPILQHNDPVG